MPVVKGGVWTNIEDEILKAAVSKYGPNQWARVSSLLARKTPKQCKARWTEWLDPGIRKIEWSKEEDERLLHLAKLMPTQWRSIAPLVGRTATQCLERYQKLLDEAEAKENDEMSLGGPAGGETAAPSADDVRRLRPGELDPDPESKPARPDTVDLDEDEKEMLSEARARLANTQGKKAKRKARERQLEESRRLAVLQKRRELKNAGINIKVVTRKPGQMDYNADIPFEKQPAPGFHDTQGELSRNEREKAMFDPRKQQLANKRKNDEDEDGEDRKRHKNEKSGPSAASKAAAKAGQMQKIREAERNSKRRPLNLPAPQVGESEMEDIIKMGMSGQKAAQGAGGNENDNTRGLIGDYSSVVGSTPIRTPRAPQEEDRVANEIRNARARTESQSALLGGENADLYEGSSTTGFEGARPSKHASATPNPMATPFRQSGVNGVGATPRGPGQTPMRTPRDNFRLNDQTPNAVQLSGQTPREVRLQEQAMKNDLSAKLGALPRPKETDWELEIPEEQKETTINIQESAEDAAVRDQRNRELQQAAEREAFKRQTQVVQKYLPRPADVYLDAMLNNTRHISDPAQRAVAEESARLIDYDAHHFGNNAQNATSTQKSLDHFSDEQLDRARMEIALEIQSAPKYDSDEFGKTWSTLHSDSIVPGLAGYGEDDFDQDQLFVEAFDNMQDRLEKLATSTTSTEKKLALHLGGYQQRQKSLRQQLATAAEDLENARLELETKRVALAGEQAVVGSRLEGLRTEVQAVLRREKVAQEVYKERIEELQSVGEGNETVNGWH